MQDTPQYLFRGQTPEGKWVYGYYAVMDGTSFIINDKRTEVLPQSVGQWTGLVDKKKSRIFGGDIVRDEEWHGVGEVSLKNSNNDLKFTGTLDFGFSKIEELENNK